MSCSACGRENPAGSRFCLGCGSVILAARVAAQAEGGEILVSSLLKELTESVGDIRFGEARQAALKGISETQRLFPVEWR